LTKPSAGIKFSQMATSQVQKNLRNAMKEALGIQDRFVAEPHFAKTGRGYLKSEGVATLQKIEASRHKFPPLYSGIFSSKLLDSVNNFLAKY
jgi:hypothetical protein